MNKYFFIKIYYLFSFCLNFMFLWKMKCHHRITWAYFHNLLKKVIELKQFSFLKVVWEKEWTHRQTMWSKLLVSPIEWKKCLKWNTAASFKKSYENAIKSKKSILSIWPRNFYIVSDGNRLKDTLFNQRKNVAITISLELNFQLRWLVHFFHFWIL